MLNRKVFVLLFIGVLVSELLVSNVEAGKGDGSSKGGKKGSQKLGRLAQSAMRNALNTAQLPYQQVAANLPSLDQVRITFQQYATRIRHELRRPISDEEVAAFHDWQLHENNYGQETYNYIFGEADQMTSDHTGQMVIDPYDFYNRGVEPQYLQDYNHYVNNQYRAWLESIHQQGRNY